MTPPRPPPRSSKPADDDGTRTFTRLDTLTIEVPSIVARIASPSAPPMEAPLGIAPVVIGSGAEADVVVRDERVSRRHCELRLSDQGVVLRDLGSKNGTFVGGLRIREATLPAEATISIGVSTITTRFLGTSTHLPLSPAARFGDAIGGSVPMRLLFSQLSRIAPTSETVLLIGESGTGKEVLARGVHDHSPRKAAPYVVLDCSAIAPNLVEDALFGHVRGAFTGAGEGRPGVFEQANGGTLFIDEIGELPLDLQPKLLRALESRRVLRLGDNASRSIDIDCRVVAATNRDLRAQVAEGAFRKDLYYRLQVFELCVPPLRQRKEDIPTLVERFLAAQIPPRRLADLPSNSMELLKAHDWPGNVRELRNTVARLLVFADAAAAISPPLAPQAESERGVGALVDLPLREARDIVVERFERDYLEAKLREAGGVVVNAAKAMGVTRQMVYKMMERHGVPRSDS